MSEELKKRLIYISLGLAAIFVIFIWPHKYVWDGEGTVNVFPEASNAKNYRLDAEMRVTRSSNGWQQGKDTYSISSADWPDGGYLEFNNCIVKQGDRDNCTSQDGTQYLIEVDSYPDPPEPESNDP